MSLSRQQADLKIGRHSYNGILHHSHIILKLDRICLRLLIVFIRGEVSRLRRTVFRPIFTRQLPTTSLVTDEIFWMSLLWIRSIFGPCCDWCADRFLYMQTNRASHKRFYQRIKSRFNTDSTRRVIICNYTCSWDHRPKFNRHRDK